MEDSTGNTYFNVRNVRITALRQTWDNENPGLRIQAYKGEGSALFQGAEIPVRDKKDAYELIEAIVQALESIEGWGNSSM